MLKIGVYSSLGVKHIPWRWLIRRQRTLPADIFSDGATQRKSSENGTTGKSFDKKNRKEIRNATKKRKNFEKLLLKSLGKKVLLPFCQTSFRLGVYKISSNSICEK